MSAWTAGEQHVRDHYFATILGVTAQDDPGAYDLLTRELDAAWAAGSGVREFCEQRAARRRGTFTTEARGDGPVKSLARFLGCTETRALDLLGDHAAYAAELRRRPRI